MIRKLLIAILSGAIFMFGLLATTMYMDQQNSLGELKTWLYFMIAYFILFRPAMAYWNDKLTNG